MERNYGWNLAVRSTACKFCGAPAGQVCQALFAGLISISAPGGSRMAHEVRVMDHLLKITGSRASGSPVTDSG